MSRLDPCTARRENITARGENIADQGETYTGFAYKHDILMSFVGGAPRLWEAIVPTKRTEDYAFRPRKS
jgi:hypothetical protein